MNAPTLRPYQVEDLAFHIANPKSLNTSDPGTGKTPTVCVLAWYHWARRQKKTVWAMPLSLRDKNKEELLRFTGFKSEDVVILTSDHAALTEDWTGPTFTRNKRVRRPTGRIGPDGEPETKMVDEPIVAKDLIAAAKEAKVFIVTFAFLSSHWRRLLATIPDIDLFLVDELHLGYGGPASAQTESFYFVNRHVNNFCGMTGTLIDGRLDSAFPAIHVIEPRYYGGYGGFLDEHSLWTNNYGKVEVWKGEEKLKQILARHSVQHTFTEVYGDEPVHFETVTGPMGPIQREEYDKFHEQAMLELEDGRILDGSMPGVALIRATQIMGHPETYLLAKGEILWKDKKLMEYATEGRPMLVFSAAVAEQERCQRVLQDQGLRAGLINNTVSGPKRSAIDAAFRAGELDAIVASGPTAGIGWNWERADHVINVSVDYKDVNFLQAYRRASRGTRTSVLRVTTLEYENSIDRRKFDILTAKSVIANKVDPNRKVLAF